MSDLSKLVINDHPIQVLPKLAENIGLNEAIILQQLHYWLRQSKNDRDGKKWIYNSYPKWNEQFPFWSRNTMIKAFKHLEKLGLITTANYNKAGFDKTKWYTINYQKLNELSDENNDISPVNQKLVHDEPETGTRYTRNWLMDEPETGKGCTRNRSLDEPETGKPIPLDYQETTPETTQKISNSNVADDARENLSNQVASNKSKVEEFRKVQQAYESTIGGMGSFVQQDILKWINDLSGDLVIEAIKRADANNVHNWKYISSILRSWANNNVKTLEAVKAKDTEFNNKKRNTSRISYSKPNNKGASFKPGDYTEMKIMADNGEIPF